jgi:DNA-binding transcriptional ArsR family regulator
MYNHMVVGELAEADVDRIFHALADATRRDILARVIRNEQSVSMLAQHYSLVTKKRRGREQIVHGDVTALRIATRLLDAYEELWHYRTSRIEQILSED